MSIRNKAIKWYQTKYGQKDGPIYTSKFYTEEESWPKKAVWWIRIPIHAVESKKHNFIHILCETAPGENDFHYLKVPTKFLDENFKKFDTLQDTLALYLSAVPKKLFIEERGEGNLDFKKFVVDFTPLPKS